MLAVLKTNMKAVAGKHSEYKYTVRREGGVYKFIRIEPANPVKPRTECVEIIARTQHELADKIDWYML